MADYSGHIDAYSVQLTFVWLARETEYHGVWTTSKYFHTGQAPVVASEPFLGFLVDGYWWGVRHAWKNPHFSYPPVVKPKIAWVQRTRQYELRAPGGVPYRYSNDEAIKWLQRNGYVDINKKLTGKRWT